MKRYLLRYGARGPGSPPAADAMGIVIGMYQFLVPHRASALIFRALSQMKGMRVIDLPSVGIRTPRAAGALLSLASAG
jgi:hypothetical protein